MLQQMKMLYHLYVELAAAGSILFYSIYRFSCHCLLCRGVPIKTHGPCCVGCLVSWWTEQPVWMETLIVSAKSHKPGDTWLHNAKNSQVGGLKTTPMWVYNCSSVHFLRGKIMLWKNRLYKVPLYMSEIHSFLSLKSISLAFSKMPNC